MATKQANRDSTERMLTRGPSIPIENYELIEILAR